MAYGRRCESCVRLILRNIMIMGGLSSFLFAAMGGSSYFIVFSHKTPSIFAFLSYPFTPYPIFIFSDFDRVLDRVLPLFRFSGLGTYHAITIAEF
jgi:hypothetical protein